MFYCPTRNVYRDKLTLKTVSAHTRLQEKQYSKRKKQKLLYQFGLLSSLPVAHGSIGWFHNKSLLLAFPAQLLDIVLELGVLGREDPGFGYEAVLLRLALNHSTETKTKHHHRQSQRSFARLR